MTARRSLGRGDRITRATAKENLRVKHESALSYTATSYIAAPVGVIYNHEISGYKTVNMGSSFIPNGHATYLSVRDKGQEIYDAIRTGVQTYELTIGSEYVLSVQDGALHISRAGEPVASFST